MPTNNSYAVLLNDWQQTLSAVDKTPDLQPSVETERQSLIQSVAGVEALLRRQQELIALKQRATQELKEARERGKEMDIKLRSVVRGKLGHKNELLVQFNVAPQRKPKRKPKDEETKEPSGEKPGTGPGGTDPGISTPPPDKPAV
jgi:hypothetical protein